MKKPPNILLQPKRSLNPTWARMTMQSQALAVYISSVNSPCTYFLVILDICPNPLLSMRIAIISQWVKLQVSQIPGQQKVHKDDGDGTRSHK
ncbi:hypothetical protein GN956_G4568 [Arapaima gigas]